MKSHGLYVPEKGRVALQEFDLPDPGPGEIQIETEYSTLSPGTERNLVLGVSPKPLPMNIGYSLSGRIRKIGAGVTRYRVGEAVVHTGRHATFVNADERFTTPVPEGTDLEQAAFFNLAHTALYGVRQAKVELGEAVAVIGQGLVGLIVARIAQLAGGLPVIAIDIDDSRLAISRAMGLQEVVNGGDASRLQRLLGDLPGGGVPVVIEVTGVRKPVEQALEIVRERGRIVLLGTTHGDETVQFHRHLSMKGASLIGGYINSKPFSLAGTHVEMPSWPPSLAPGQRRYVGPGVWTSDDDIRVIMNLLRYGQLDLRPLITHRFTPQQAPAAYQMVVDQDKSLVGGVIRWK